MRVRDRWLLAFAALSAIAGGIVFVLWQVSRSSNHSINTTVLTPPPINFSTPILTASPSRLNDGGDLVISWANIQTPHQRDFIALTCGTRGHATDFFRKHDINNSTSISFPLLYMMRCNYTAIYFNWNTTINDHQEITYIQVPMTDSSYAPKHGHIAFSDNPDAMAIMFNSASNRTPHVQYGTDAALIDQYARGTSTTYKADDMCEAPANTISQVCFRDPGYMHTIILTALKPSTTYYYRFGNADDGWSSVQSFTSRAGVNSTKHAKFIAYADMGVNGIDGSATSTAARSYHDITTNGFDHFLLHFGDISYARGFSHIWDQFFHIIEPYATRVPYMVSIGNHEYDYQTGGQGHDPSEAVDPITNGMAFRPKWGNFGTDSGGECSVPMVHRFHSPSNGKGLYWYSFDERGVHVIQVSSEHDWTRGSEQYKWLEEDLKQVDRSITPWIVLTCHRMMYTTQLGEDADLEVSYHFREEVEDLLRTYHVNLMLTGHQHSYERSCTVYKGECMNNGTVHVVVGSAGAGIESMGFSDAIGNWSVSHLNDWGYVRIESNETAMNVEFVLNRNGSVYDQFTLQPW